MVAIDRNLLGGDARRLKLDTLIRLRWLAVTGQCLALAFVHLELGYQFPFGACLAAVAAAAMLNLWLRIRRPASYRLGSNEATLLLGFDVLQLAALLYLTGGLQNPFAILFLAPVLISATALAPERTLALGLLASACAAFLAFFHHELPWNGPNVLELPHLYVRGILTAILLGIAFTGVFAYRVAEEARQLAAALAATELVLAREQHLSQLDGLAAAAAHELGTPLATIALVSKELDLQAVPGSAMADDTKLLREQVERCRSILSRLTSLHDDAGAFLETISLEHLIEEIAEPQRPFDDVDIRIECSGSGPEPFCRRSPGLLYGLGNLVDNGVDFARSRLTIEATWSIDTVTIEIRDDGPGFAPEVLLRAGEPYVTTRAAGHSDDENRPGLGLGLFIAKTLIERSGGQLTLANAALPAGGAVVRITWPRPSFEGEAAYDAKAVNGQPLPMSDPAPI